MAEAMAAFAALSVIGGGLSAVGTLQAADARGKAAEVEAASLEEQGAVALQAGKERARQARVLGRRTAGAQTAAFGASGVVAGTGTPLLVLAETARQSELEAIKGEFAGAYQESVARKQAALTRYGARIARRESNIAAAGSLLTGGARGLLIGSSGAPKATGLAFTYPDTGPGFGVYR